MAPDLSFGSIPRLQGVALGAKLGEGGFGVVWRGTLAEGTECAVKELKVPASGLSPAEKEEKFQVLTLIWWACVYACCVLLCV